MFQEVDQKLLDRLSPRLKAIVAEEVAAGNRVSETSQGWPYPETVFVGMAKPFTKKYDVSGLAYTELNDRHYWKAEYLDEATKHLLVCRFDDFAL